MNNSRLVIEPTLSDKPKEDVQEKLREREQKLVHIIEAIQALAQSKDWGSLKTEVFDGLTRSLKSRLYDEAKKESPDTGKLNRITGQLIWAEKYSDLSKLESQYRVELTRIRQHLHGKTD